VGDSISLGHDSLAQPYSTVKSIHQTPSSPAAETNPPPSSSVESRMLRRRDLVTINTKVGCANRASCKIEIMARNTAPCKRQRCTAGHGQKSGDAGWTSRREVSGQKHLDGQHARFAVVSHHSPSTHFLPPATFLPVINLGRINHRNIARFLTIFSLLALPSEVT
jgi:hypothetical protein